MNAILNIRKRLSVSQVGLSHELGVTQSLISQYENGMCHPSLRVARRLVDIAKSRGIDLTLDAIYSTCQDPIDAEHPSPSSSPECTA